MAEPTKTAVPAKETKPADSPARPPQNQGPYTGSSTAPARADQSGLMSDEDNKAAQKPNEVGEDGLSNAEREQAKHRKRESGAQYRLMNDHYLRIGGNDLYLPRDTVIGAGTPYPYDGPPSLAMAGANEEGEEEIKRNNEKRFDPLEVIGMSRGHIPQPDRPNENAAPKDS